MAEELGPVESHKLIDLHRSGTKLLRERAGGQVGFYAVGGLGQRLAIYPRAGIVAVRQHRQRPGDDQRKSLVAWRDFYDHVEALDPELARPKP